MDESPSWSVIVFHNENIFTIHFPFHNRVFSCSFKRTPFTPLSLYIVVILEVSLN